MTRGELRVIADTDHVQCGDAAAMANMLLELMAVPTFEEWCQRKEQKPVGWVREAMKEAYDDCRTAMLKAGPVTATAVPDGWKLVPVEPTEEMCKAGYEAQDKWPYERADTYKEMCHLWTHPRYKAMIDAAPAAPDNDL
jgi:hypothetical protein